MSRDILGAGGVAGTIFALFEFGFLHAPELLTVVGPLVRLADDVPWLPAATLADVRTAILVLVVLFGLYRLANSAAERFKT
ncbi:hypothetical protein [Halobacterium wangiae]|uniref:hypothetical protein n=1 Tax=Halobacterium wangiae TaxID=2902623 RepID=UPI001E43E9DE|nr:hypothetical protein [Halobacterium wangiae]